MFAALKGDDSHPRRQSETTLVGQFGAVSTSSPEPADRSLPKIASDDASQQSAAARRQRVQKGSAATASSSPQRKREVVARLGKKPVGRVGDKLTVHRPKVSLELPNQPFFR
jgi:hypothetical protein